MGRQTDAGQTRRADEQAEQAEVRTDTRQTQSRQTQSRQGWVE